jgi:hypothetical protein
LPESNSFLNNHLPPSMLSLSIAGHGYKVL